MRLWSFQSSPWLALGPASDPSSCPLSVLCALPSCPRTFSCDGSKAYGGLGALNCIPNIPWDGWGTCKEGPPDFTLPPYTMPPNFNETIDELEECIEFFRDLENHTPRPTPSKPDPDRTPSIAPTIAASSPTTPSPLTPNRRDLSSSMKVSV